MSDVERVFRAEHGRAVAVLARLLGDLSLAEEAVQDAFITALERWPRDGTPPAPAGWILTTARNRAIDRLRRESTRDTRHAEAMRLLEAEEVDELAVDDDTLRLVFTCCHPALALEAQLALTLRLVAGLHTGEIARAFLVPEATLAQRISRAKAKISAAGIPYRAPEADELPARLRGVLAVVYLLFNEGHTATRGETLVNHTLCEEAIRLGRLLLALLPREPEARGLLALMLLSYARRDARIDAAGIPVQLAQQDRTRWNRALIAEGLALVRDCLALGVPGVYQLQAAISAVHSDAADAARTDWRQVVALYDQLMALAPTPVVALNRAIACAELQGPAQALRLVDELALARYHPFHATRAELLRRLGRADEARAAYDQAVELCANGAERRFFEHARDGLRGAPGA